MEHAFLLNLLKPLATLASGLGKQKKLLILIYHRVLDEPDFMRPGEVDKVAFTWQMELLAKHFNVLPLYEAVERMQNNDLPSRAVSITFDDGYTDNYTNALPILKQFNLTATFFSASGFLDGGRMWNDTVIESVRNMKLACLDLTKIGLGKFDVGNEIQKCEAANQIIQLIKYLPIDMRLQYTNYIAEQSQDLPINMMMTSEQVKFLFMNGMDIGGHTVNHPILAKLDKSDVYKEIKDNKLMLERLIGKTLKVFAYPNGKVGKDYLIEQVEIIKQEGYLLALSTNWGCANYNSDHWQLPRFTPWDRKPINFMLRMINKFLYSN